jgi:hypothetical protein
MSVTLGNRMTMKGPAGIGLTGLIPMILGRGTRWMISGGRVKDTNREIRK